MAEVDARELLAQAKDLSARYARRLGPEEAADLAGEALARGLERPPADGRMAPWLERIARNLLVDRWRRARVAESARLDPPEPSPSPEELLLAGERRRLVRRSLARLQRAQRRSILARYYGASAASDAVAATLRTRLHRGLARLRQLTRGLLALAPPIRLFRVLPLMLNPAAAVVFLVAQQAAVPVVPAGAPPSPAVVSRHGVAPRPAPVPPAEVPRTVVSRPAAPARPAASAAPVRYEFEDDQIEAELQRPDDVIQSNPRKVRHASLIEIPDSFVPSIAKSVEDL
jgi:DNA-directed RNA polymerase specialized sigma24 family protein